MHIARHVVMLLCDIINLYRCVYLCPTFPGTAAQLPPYSYSPRPRTSRIVQASERTRPTQPLLARLEWATAMGPTCFEENHIPSVGGSMERRFQKGSQCRIIEMRDPYLMHKPCRTIKSGICSRLKSGGRRALACAGYGPLVAPLSCTAPRSS